MEPRGAVERATELSDEMVQALEDSARAAVEAVERFLVSLEEALPQESRACPGWRRRSPIPP